MRILQVVTLTTPDNAYGGPLTVAVNQSRALRELGHDVTLVASHRGYAERPARIGGTEAKLGRARTIVPWTGYAGLWSPQTVRWLTKRLGDFDVAHVHLARDLVTLPAAYLLQSHAVPVYLQTHGMIDPSQRKLARALDSALTRRVLDGAVGTFYLTEDEMLDLLEVKRSSGRFIHLPNGVPRQPINEKRCEDPREILFLARLQERKRPLLFVKAAISILDRGLDATFTVVGPDEGLGREIDAMIARSGHENKIRREPAVSADSVTRRISQAYLYVLPSINEPYPMSVLESLSVGVPVVITNTCGLASDIEAFKAGIVVTPDEEALTDAIVSIIQAPDIAAKMGISGRRYVTQKRSMTAVAEVLEKEYLRR